MNRLLRSVSLTALSVGILVAAAVGMDALGFNSRSPDNDIAFAPSSPLPSFSPPAAERAGEPCAPLVVGQQSLAPLEPPPSGYNLQAGLDWTGCGDQVVPLTSAPIEVPDLWLLAESHSCPLGTAPDEDDTAITVTELPANHAPIMNAPMVDGSDLDTSISTGTGPDDALLYGGSFHLRIQSARPNCRWVIAIYIPN